MKISCKSTLIATGVALGGFGLAICLASLLVVWIASARATRVAESVFQDLERAIATVGQRIAKTQDRFQAATVTIEEIKASLGEWSEREAAQRVALQLQVAERTERLSGALQQASDWLILAQSLAKL